MGPMTVVTPGSPITTTSLSELVLDSKIPFTKLDTTNIVSFQTISILFSNEPSQPPSSAPYYSNTLIYSFAHGYNYIPSVWLMWQNGSPEFPANPSSGNSATTYYAFGDDTAGVSALSAINGSVIGSDSQVAQVVYNNGSTNAITTVGLLYVLVDNTNVYIYLMKETLNTVGGSVIPLYMAGVTLDLRCYVFAEPASTSTY